MESYLNNPELKTLAIQRLKNAIKTDILVQTKYDSYNHWKNGKGTIAGCISELNEIEDAAKMFGFPVQLLKIQDIIFRFLDKEKAAQFGLDFLEAIPLGVDLNFVWKKYFIWLLAEVDGCTMDVLNHIPLAKDTIERAVETLKESLITEISVEKLDGIIKELSEYRKIVGQAADAGSIEPDYAGWELAKAHWALQSYTMPSFVPYVLPQAGSNAMWEFLAEQLIEIIKNGKTAKNTFDN